MKIEDFAAKYRLRVKRDENGNEIVLGKTWRIQPKSVREDSSRLPYGHQIFEHGVRMAVLLTYEVEGSSRSGLSAKWTGARQKLKAAGFTVTQDGGAEGVALFNPEDKAQAKLAIKLAGAKIRREMSPERKAILSAQLAAGRLKAAA